MPKLASQRPIDRYITRKEFFGVVGLAVAAVAGVTGLIKHLESLAATPTAFEPENGVLGGAATVVTNASASGGKGVKFGPGTTSGGVSDASLAALIASVPPTAAGPAPSGPTAGDAGQFDTSIL